MDLIRMIEERIKLLEQRFRDSDNINVQDNVKDIFDNEARIQEDKNWVDQKFN